VKDERDRKRKIEEKHSFAVGIDACVVQSLYCGNENSRVSPLCLGKTPETSSNSLVGVNWEWSSPSHLIFILCMGEFGKRSRKGQVLLV